MTIGREKKKTATEQLEAKYGPLTFADVLKSERLCDEMSQNQVAKMLGISKKCLDDFEKGRRFPCLEFAKIAAKKFGDHPKIWQDCLKADIERAAKKKQNIVMPAS